MERVGVDRSLLVSKISSTLRLFSSLALGWEILDDGPS